MYVSSEFGDISSNEEETIDACCDQLTGGMFNKLYAFVVL